MASNVSKRCRKASRVKCRVMMILLLSLSSSLLRCCLLFFGVLAPVTYNVILFLQHQHNKQTIMTVIAVAGGTGGVGIPIVDVLSQHPTYHVIVLTRNVCSIFRRQSETDPY